VVLRDTGWTTVFHPKPASEHRLVYFPHSGGSAGAAAPLSAAAPPEVEVVAIQYPGRQWRQSEPAAADIWELAGGAAHAILAMDGKRVTVFGHSLGAIAGFEAARLLEENQPGLVTRLFASGSGAPSRPRRLALSEDASDDDLIGELQRMGGTDQTMFADPEALRLVLPALRDDYRAMKSYLCPPDVRITAPITALLGMADPSTTHDEALGWSAHTHAAFDIRTFPGGHFYLNQNRQEVLDTVLAPFRPAGR
jgi:surfactin synthase thioesterase subunit